jgi:ankyrin repeat protein
MKGNIECMKLLEEYGQDLEMKTRSGRTPLEIAAAYGQDEMVTYLLSEDCSMDNVPKSAKHGKVRDAGCRLPWLARMTVTLSWTWRLVDAVLPQHAATCAPCVVSSARAC